MKNTELVAHDFRCDQRFDAFARDLLYCVSKGGSAVTRYEAESATLSSGYTNGTTSGRHLGERPGRRQPG